MTISLLIHLAVTWMLVGLIWVIQIVIYPQFHRVGEAEFIKYHFAHCFRIGLLVVPLAMVEAVTAAWLLYQGHREMSFVISLGLLPVVWLSTAVFQGPFHVRLMRGYENALMRRLMVTNWLRTIGWTARGVLVICMAATC